MTELKNIWEKLRKDKKSLATVAIGFLGIALILLSEIPAFSAEKSTAEITQGEYYRADLEKQTEKLISQVKGAGKVSVMLTYESNEEQVFAKDKEENTSSEKDKKIAEKHIVVDSGGDEKGLTVKVIYPKIRGVAVVCSGGDDPEVKRQISALLSALFDIGANRISIARRAEQE